MTAIIHRAWMVVTGLAVTAAGLGLAWTLSTRDTQAATTGADHHATRISLLAHLTNIEFITTAGATSTFPTRPLAPGDRVLGRDNLLQGGSVAGYDNEVCTVTFAGNVLCDDILTLSNRGQVHVSWSFRWPATTYDGVVDGGTSEFRGVSGDFHAVVQPDGDVQITADVR